MNREEDQLKNEFKQLMDENYPDVPSFEDLVDADFRQIKRPLLPRLTIAASILLFFIAGYFLFQKKPDRTSEISWAQWEAPSSSWLSPPPNKLSISNWTSPTDFLIPNKFKQDEK